MFKVIIPPFTTSLGTTRHRVLAIAGGLLLILSATLSSSAQQPPNAPAPKPAMHDSRLDVGFTINGAFGTAAGHASNGGVGLTASYFLVKTERAIAFDAQITEFLVQAPSTVVRGGRMTQALFGMKIIPIGSEDSNYDPKFNSYFKVRPGFISWSDAVIGLAQTPQGLVATRIGRSTVPAIDFGLSFERYLAKNWWLRFDAGDTVVWYQGMNVAGGGRVDGATKSNLQLGTGMFYRF